MAAKPATTIDQLKDAWRAREEAREAGRQALVKEIAAENRLNVLIERLAAERRTQKLYSR